MPSTGKSSNSSSSSRAAAGFCWSLRGFVEVSSDVTALVVGTEEVVEADMVSGGPGGWVKGGGVGCADVGCARLTCFG